MPQKIQFRRDTQANFVSNNVILSAGEPAYTTDTKTYRVGDGVTAFNALPVLANKQEVQAAMDAATAAQADANAAQATADNALTSATNANNAVTALAGRVTTLENAPALTVIDGGNASGT